MEGEAKGKTFKMNGHALPGINQKLDANAANVAEQGLAGSSAFQQFSGIEAVRSMAGNIQASNIGRGPGRGGPPTQPQTWNVGQPPMLSKPSVAKIYDKPKGKRTEY